MKRSQIKLLILTMILYIVTILSNKLLIKDSDYNSLVLSLPILMPEIRRRFDKIWALIFSVILVAATLILALPAINVISREIFIIVFLLFLALYFYPDLFTPYLKKITKKELLLQQNIHELKKMKDELASLSKLNEEVEKEIKDVTSLYGTIKELGSRSLTLTDSIGNITETIKRIIKYNFKISLEEINFFMIIKKGNVFSVAQSFGFDENYLKENEKTIIDAILKRISDKRDIIYTDNLDNSSWNKSENIFNKSMLYVPFYVENKLLGVLFFSGSRENIFDEKQIASIKILTNQIAILLEKVFLYEEEALMSKIDSLTGLFVHREFQERLENELKRSARYQKELGLIMGDIDFFKKMNDYYGHLAGDYVLKTIALILKNNTNPADSVARYGGEEFMIILPDSDKKNAFLKAESIRKAIENYEFAYKGTKMGVTMSFGVAAYPGDAITRRALIDKADKALYKAKQTGRNKVLKSE